MTVKRYYAHKHLINEDKVHDKICHRFMNISETVEHMNMYYQKYTTLKQENEQLKQQIEELEFKLRTIENKELKTFKDKVFEVIDNHILEETDLRKECIENGSHYNANICRNIIDTLKLIKKELGE